MVNKSSTKIDEFHFFLAFLCKHEKASKEEEENSVHFWRKKGQFQDQQLFFGLKERG